MRLFTKQDAVTHAKSSLEVISTANREHTPYAVFVYVPIQPTESELVHVIDSLTELIYSIKQNDPIKDRLFIINADKIKHLVHLQYNIDHVLVNPFNELEDMIGPDIQSMHLWTGADEQDKQYVRGLVALAEKYSVYTVTHNMVESNDVTSPRTF